MIQFNFGPIARTSAGGTHDTINLTSLPLHVMLNALVGSTSVEEFIAWLWHDLYKPAFYWVISHRTGNPSWHHVPGIGAFAQAEKTFAQRMNIREGLVKTHHGFQSRTPHFALHETDFISDQGDQINLGAAVNYIQLSLAAEPALPTLLTRSVIADAFIQVVTKDVAKALNKAFIDNRRTPIERVRFEFETASNLTFSSSPNDAEKRNAEIWNKIGKHFDICLDGNIFTISHLTPVTDATRGLFATTFTADLTGKPLLPHEMLDNVVSLSELLVLYQDSRTVIIAVPQSQLYSNDLPKKIQEIQKATLDTSRRQLEQHFNILTQKDGDDYLKAAFDHQIEIREVPRRLGKCPPKNDLFRPLNDAVQRPVEMLSKTRNSSNKRVCRLTGTPFVSNLPPAQTRLDQLFSSKFVDTEFVGFEEDIAPLTHLYVINSPEAKKGTSARKSLRGSFAFFAPVSHYASDDQELKAVEQPPLDIGGRFHNQFNRITVTTQEFTMFQQMSRRVIAKLWQQIAPDEHLPLPYLGAIALTHEKNERVRNLLPHLDLIFSDIALKAYPFESVACPAIEVALGTTIKPDRSAHQKHTLLKMAPYTTSVNSLSTIPILIDDNVQVSLTKAFFERGKLLTEVTNELKRSKKRMNQKNLWLKLVLSNNDPVTAVFESSAATINMTRIPKTSSLEDTAFKDAEDFWNRHIDTGDFAESWKQYVQLKQNTTNALEEFPALLLLLQSLQKQTQEPQNPAKVEKNKTSTRQQLNLFTPQNTDEI
ncbi:MAG: hypothetical protein OXU36_20815 [Candidatus Poribacteria bacterium]|nr:hypothetical protein [Candidatus Poribacteria bacterium]